MDEVDLLGQEDFLQPEEAEEAEQPEPWWEALWRREPVVAVWLAVLLVTWSLLALSDWLGPRQASQAAAAPARSQRSRRSLLAYRSGARQQTQAPQQQTQVPQQAPRVPQQAARAAAEAAVAPAAAAAPAGADAPPSACAMASPPTPAPAPAPGPAPTPTPARVPPPPPPPQIVRAPTPPPPAPEPQGSDESLEEPPQPLPPASIKHVNVLLSGRLWHEASLELLRLVSEPDSSLVKNEEQARALLSHHIKLLHKRASPLVLARIAVHVADWLPDVEERCALLQATGRDVAASDVAAAVCRVRTAELLLQRGQHQGKDQELGQQDTTVDDALRLLEDVEERLVETVEVVPQDVSASCYRLLAQCYSSKKDLARYQDAALKYLCHVDPNSLPEEERKFIATELVVCSLLSEDINATAEMRLRPVLWALEESASEGWLAALLEAADDGDVAGVRAAAPLLHREPRLLHGQHLIQERAAIRALQAVCRSQRHLSMEEAAEAAQVSEDEAEQLVLRALARGAIDGFIDMGTLFVERVRPSPVGVMQLLPDMKKLDKWLKNVSEQETRFAGQMESLIGL